MDPDVVCIPSIHNWISLTIRVTEGQIYARQVGYRKERVLIENIAFNKALEEVPRHRSSGLCARK
jgi:hypothetical protein